MCLSCDVDIFLSNKSSVIERSSEFDYRSLVNRMFDLQKVIASSIVFDWVRQSNEWCSIGFEYRTVRLDTHCRESTYINGGSSSLIVHVVNAALRNNGLRVSFSTRPCECIIPSNEWSNLQVLNIRLYLKNEIIESLLVATSGGSEYLTTVHFDLICCRVLCSQLSVLCSQPYFTLVIHNHC